MNCSYVANINATASCCQVSPAMSALKAGRTSRPLWLLLIVLTAASALQESEFHNPIHTGSMGVVARRPPAHPSSAPPLTLPSASSHAASPNHDAAAASLVAIFTTLINDTLQQQQQETRPYDPPNTFPPQQFESIRGLFRSSIRINTHGPALASAFRNWFALPDVNGFVTLAVTHHLVDALSLCAQVDTAAQLHVHTPLEAPRTAQQLQAHLSASTGTSSLAQVSQPHASGQAASTAAAEAAAAAAAGGGQAEAAGRGVSLRSTYSQQLCQALPAELLDQVLAAAATGLQQLRDPRPPNQHQWQTRHSSRRGGANQHGAPLLAFWPWTTDPPPPPQPQQQQVKQQRGRHPVTISAQPPTPQPSGGSSSRYRSSRRSAPGLCDGSSRYRCRLRRLLLVDCMHSHAGAEDVVPPHTWPANVVNLFTSNAAWLQRLCSLLRWVHLSSLADMVEAWAAGMRSGVLFFSIPPDADDTGCTQGLVWQLAQQQELLPQAAEAAVQLAEDPAGRLLQVYAQYAYRPLSPPSPSGGHMLDPRSYMWLHPHLVQQQQLLQGQSSQQQQHKDGGRSQHSPTTRGSTTSSSCSQTSNGTQQGPAIFTTWFQDQQQQLLQHPWVQTPLRVNNVDAAVAVNALYGITSALLLRPQAYLDPVSGQLPCDVAHAFNSTLAAVVWAVESGRVTRRPDLVTLYYPTKWPLYAHLARWYQQLQRALEGPATALPASPLSPAAAAAATQLPELRHAFSTLEQLLQGPVTEQLLSSANSISPEGFVVWDGFVGQGDTSWGSPAPVYDDRVWSTSLVVNTLLEIWTVRGKRGSPLPPLAWRLEAPAAVREATAAAHRFLLAPASGLPTAAPYFSASLKGGLGSSLQLYPHTYACNLFNSSMCYTCGSIGPGKVAKGSHFVRSKGRSNGAAVFGEGMNSSSSGGSSSSSSCEHRHGGLGQPGASAESDPVEAFADWRDTVIAVQGVLPDQEFQHKQQGSCLGFQVQQNDPGRNCASCVFPYWDAPVLTSSARALALLKVQLLLEGELPGN